MNNTVYIVCKESKKGNIFYALVIDKTYVCFDVPTMAKAFGISPRDIYLLNVGEYIYYNERSSD